MKKALRKYCKIQAKKPKKSCLFILIFISLFIFILPVFSVAFVQAESVDASAQTQLNDTLLQMLNELDLQALEDYVKGLENLDTGSVKERLIAYVKGESFDYANFFANFISVLLKGVGDLLPAFACITAVSLLSGVLGELRGGNAGGTSGVMINLITYVSALIPLLGVLIECFERSVNGVTSMQKQMQIVYPLLLTLMATTGGSVSVAVCKPTVAFFSNVIVSAIVRIVFPLTITIIAFSMAGNLTRELKINKFSAFFKSINKWLIGICVSVFGLFFSLQGITSASYDGIVRRTVKYAIGNGVPIVGGFLSGGYDLAVAGGILLKNSLGNMSIFLLVAVLFEPLVLLLATSLLLRFTSAVTQPFGDSRVSDFLSETADNIQYCTAGLLFTAFLYFLSIVLMLLSSEALL